MIEIIIPDLPATRQLQETQGRYYWSRAAELLFRREGVISVRRTCRPSADNSTLLICRDTAAPSDSGKQPRVFEGPLPADTLDTLGLQSTRCEAQTLMVDHNSSLALHLPEILVRRADKTTAALEFDDSAAKWRNSPFQVQFLSGAGWTPVLYATEPTRGLEGAIAVRRGRDLVIGVSAFDLLARWLAVPPLAARYGGFSRMMRHDLLSERFVSLVLEHAGSAGGTPALVIDRWPRGHSSALTVRHDCDRQADPSLIQHLLQHYDDLGVRASIGFLPYFLEQDTIAAFEARGHEIQGHVASPTRIDLREDLRRLRNESRGPVLGVTIHGGPQGIGFRGQTHFEWFDDNGLGYCETFGIRDTIPVPVCRLYDDVPDCSRMIATPGHLSLDGSTAPDDHRLDTLLVSVPRSLERGNHTIIMNHPDVHHDQLCTLLSRIGWHGVWRATTAEVIQWHRVSRYESVARWTAAGYEVSFPQSLPYVATLSAGHARFELEVQAQPQRWPMPAPASVAGQAG